MDDTNLIFTLFFLVYMVVCIVVNYYILKHEGEDNAQEKQLSQEPDEEQEKHS